MVDTETARTIVGIVGNVISFGLFLSPIPTFITIWKKKTASGFKPDPYVATVLNCAMWVFYGMPFVHPDSLLVVTINGFGFCLELIYVGIFFIYSPWKRRRNILLALLVELIFMVAVVAITLLVLHTTGRRSTLVGILCIIFNIAMYTSPLTIMRRVIQTKSVKYMPFFLSLTNFLNGVIWAVYALLKFDPFVLVPNALGSLSGLVQLILYATYYRTTKWDEPEKPTSEVEISGA
ncbi:bidirectional sugar transporter SWEET5 [Eucalyptus grandis]|uniref:bidirectional sugar transporter SWEET5 n=1 Tax=Eucalyptus grandis TaxID=71139 RepID=UPI00192EFBBE|nr:bidirectional sugar transporter SWEET5 [Eucalyptus grandis]